MKAKTVGEIIKNRPPTGILDGALAAEYKVCNLVMEVYQSLVKTVLNYNIQ